VPLIDTPHFQQKAASSRSSLAHFQQYTKGYSDVRISRRGLKLDAPSEVELLIEASIDAAAAAR
jgi:hypothetical protein